MSRISMFGLVVLGCAGQEGAVGEQGERGRAGESAVVESAAADEDQCPTGGTVLTVGVGDELEEVVLCNGAPGPQGERGPRGDAGATAEQGLGRVELWMGCEGALTDTVSLYAVHQATIFSDGSAFVSASVSDGITQVGETAFYAPAQVGAAMLLVAFTFDVQGPGIGGQWLIGIDSKTLESRLEYTDTDWPGGGNAWVKQSSDCTVWRAN